MKKYRSARLIFLFLSAVCGASVFGVARAEDVGAAATHGNSTDDTASITTASTAAIELVKSNSGTLGVMRAVVQGTTTATHGYNLTLAGISGDADNSNLTSLYLTEGGVPDTTRKIPSIQTAGAALSDNTWGWAVDSGSYDYSGLVGKTFSGSDLSNYGYDVLPFNPIPTENEAAVATALASEAELPVYFGVRINSALDTGTYSNSVRFTAVVETPNYQDNGALAVSPSESSAGKEITLTTDYENVSGDSAALDPSNIHIYFFTGAEFTGATESNVIAECETVAIDSSENGSSGHPLQLTCTVPNDSDFVVDTAYGIAVQLPDAVTSQIFTYWADAVFTFTKSGDTMQSFDGAACSAISTYDAESEFQLTDERTGAKYYIRKLRDGNCWMVQNLWLPGSMTLTPADSDITTGYTYTLPSSSTSGYTTSDTSVARMYSASANGTYTSGTGGHIDDQYDNQTTNTGAFFSWMAATAGSGNYYKQSTLVRPVSGNSAQASDSVCPKGWKLPTGGSGGQFQTVYTNSSYNSYSNFKTKAWPHALVGDCYSSSCTNYRGSGAVWWSSTQNSSSSAYALYVDSSAFYPTYSGSKFVGFSVRCVLAGS